VLQNVQKNSSIHVAVTGGGEEARSLCDDLQARLPRSMRTALHHIGEDGALWNGAGALGPLESAVARVTARVRSGESLRPLEATEVSAARQAYARLAAAEQAAAQLLGRRRAPATIALLVALGLIYGLELLWGGPDAIGTLYRMGASDRASVLNGQWWRLITPALLHGGPVHILVNGWSLWALGAVMEPLLGSARFLTLYTLGGIVAAVASTALGAGMSVGASGAIFALAGALLALVLRPRGILPPTMAAWFRRGLLVPLIVNAGFSLAPGIDWHAHLGGAVAGFVLVGSGLLVRGVPPVEMRPQKSTRSVGWLIGAVLCVVVTGVAFASALVHERPWDRSPGNVERTAIPGTRLSLMLPRRLAENARYQQGKEQIEAVFGGGLETDLSVSVLVIPDPSAAFLSPDDLGQVLLDQANELHEPEFTRTTAPHLQRVSGLPAADFVETRRDGLKNETWITARQEGLVVLSVYSQPGTRPDWLRLGNTFISSVREEPAR
jgi:rhomboid protease GluP